MRSASAARTPSRWPPGRSTEIVALIEALIDSGHAYQANGDVYFRVRSFDLRKALQPRPRRDGPGRGGRHRLPQGGPARLRPLEGPQGGRGHRLGVALGRGPARLAHRVLGDGGEASSGTDFAIHGGGIDLVFPHHENEIAQTEAARGVPLAGSGCTTGWSRSTRRRCRSRSATSSSSPRRSTATAARRSSPTWSPATTASRSPSPMSSSRRRPRGSSGSATTSETRRPASPTSSCAERREAFLAALADDFNTPQAFAVLFEIVAEGNRRELPGAREVLTELLPCWGSIH